MTTLFSPQDTPLPANDNVPAAAIVAGSNALRADVMSAAERLDEVAEILAAGVMRLRGRKSSPFFKENGENLVDFPAYRSGHANPGAWGESHA